MTIGILNKKTGHDPHKLTIYHSTVKFPRETQHCWANNTHIHIYHKIHRKSGVIFAKSEHYELKLFILNGAIKCLLFTLISSSQQPSLSSTGTSHKENQECN